MSNNASMSPNVADNAARLRPDLLAIADLVEPGWRGAVDRHGNLLLTHDGAQT